MGRLAIVDIFHGGARGRKLFLALSREKTLNSRKKPMRGGGRERE